MPTRKNSHGNPERRQREAKERQEVSDKLTIEQKLASAVGAKTKAKYTKQVAATDAAAAKTKK